MVNTLEFMTSKDTHLLIEGGELMVKLLSLFSGIVQDRGGVINGNRIDIYFESHQDALNFGVQYKEIYTERNESND